MHGPLRGSQRGQSVKPEGPGSIPDEVTGIHDLPNSSSRFMALGSAQTLTKIRARSIPGSEGRLERKADNRTVIGEPTL
jgi:hypothetical protein